MLGLVVPKKGHEAAGLKCSLAILCLYASGNPGVERTERQNLLAETLFIGRKSVFFPCNPTVIDPSWGLGHGLKRVEVRKKVAISRGEGFERGRTEQRKEESVALR